MGTPPRDLDLADYTVTSSSSSQSSAYRLKSIFSHIGSSKNDEQYITLVSDDESKNQFYLFKDENVSLIKNPQRYIRQAYLLLYEKQNHQQQEQQIDELLNNVTRDDYDDNDGNGMCTFFDLFSNFYVTFKKKIQASLKKIYTTQFLHINTIFQYIL